MNLLEKMMTKITKDENHYVWSKLDRFLGPYRNINVNYVNSEDEKNNMVLTGNGKYGLNINEVKIKIDNLKSKGKQVNILVFDAGNVYGDVSIKIKQRCDIDDLTGKVV